MMRCFVGLPCVGKIKNKYELILPALRRVFPSLKPVSSDCLHLTLQFLGEIEEAKIALFSSSLKEIAQTSNSISWKVDKLGMFPNEQHPHVLWVGGEAHASLSNLAKRVSDTVSSTLGIEPERRPFVPHITLGRWKVETLSIPPGLLETLWQEELLLSLTTLTLYSSVLTYQGAQYQVLWEAELYKEHSS